MAHLCEPTGCVGFGLESRRRNGYGSQGLSDHAAESGPWTSECKRQQKYQVNN